jgi:hypothetical protein
MVGGAQHGLSFEKREQGFVSPFDGAAVLRPGSDRSPWPRHTGKSCVGKAFGCILVIQNIAQFAHQVRLILDAFPGQQDIPLKIFGGGSRGEQLRQFLVNDRRFLLPDQLR